ncbi:hypothetical protein K0M31_012530 [Melipona bicolor]|uniref:Uncharacterized protein n=1 Tax=Melipona bicolor TaxID=60889 RepID=A0AA40FJD1_9HYME|nr:hypothetical protein K0M31_012530 [Melipona bicolor]
MQGHGARAKRSYPRVSQTCGMRFKSNSRCRENNEFSSKEKDDTKPVRETTLLDKNLQRQRHPKDTAKLKLNSRSSEIKTKLKRNSSFQSASKFPSNRHGSNFAKERGISKNIIDFRRNSNPIDANESRAGGAKRELTR